MALANEIAENVEIYHCSIRQPWLSFAPQILPRFGRNIIWQKHKPNFNQAPDAIICCGRSMAAVGKYYKRKLKCKLIQILNPRDNPKKYDILICPQHDELKGENIINTQGSLHNISSEKLKQLKPNCQRQNNVFKDKLCTLLLGNPAKGFYQELEKLSQDIKKHFSQHRLFICASRRTAKKQHAKIKQYFPNANIWLDNKDGENPYMCLLACSDVFLVTADSINMLSETCASDKAVIALAQNYISPKHQRFVKSIANRLSSMDSIQSTNKPLAVLKQVAQQTLRKV